MDAATELAARREGDEAEGVHRLRDIVVEEVSLVDRAANKRRFLVVKRSDDMADDEGVTAADEDVEKAKKKPAASEDKASEEKRRARAAEKDDDDEAQKARGAGADDDDDESDDAEKARTSDDDEEDDRKKAKDEDGAGDEKKTPRKKQDVLALPASVKEASLRVLTEALERLMAVASRIQQATETADEAALPEDVLAELGAVAELLVKLGAAKSRASKAEVAKAGARMAKDRLDRFQKALSLLADILKELTESKPAPAGPSAGAAESGVKKRDGEGASPAVPGLAELVSGIGELTRVVKRHEEELTRIRQARGVSNAIPVDGAGRKAEPQEVSWPLDMNRPISRDKVKKETSFFDE